MLKNLIKDINKLKNPKKAKLYAGYFKTGKGEYGDGDVFLGLTMPQQHVLSKKYIDLLLKDIKYLINHKIHEYRMTGLLILVKKYKRSKLEKDKKQIYDFYLKNTKKINNWDLVDVTAPTIVGNYLLDKPRNILYKLARSKNLWEKRISVLATFAFIKENQFKDSLKIAELLLKDKHDLIHKAVGWMLREIGKKDQKIEEKFLKKHYKTMPRTMLRYSIERFSKKKRQFYMKKTN